MRSVAQGGALKGVLTPFSGLVVEDIRGVTSYLRLLDCCSDYRRERGWGFLAEGPGLKYPSSMYHVTMVMTRLSPFA